MYRECRIQLDHPLRLDLRLRPSRTRIAISNARETLNLRLSWTEDREASYASLERPVWK
jgi:hypothetical protein